MHVVRAPSWGAFGLALACLILAGCGGGSSLSVKGNVTVAGQPLEEGAISFEPADGIGPSLGGKIEAGHYQVTGRAASGKKIVRIRGVQKTGRKIEAGMPAPKGTMVDEIKQLPDIYNDKSTLDIDLPAGKVIEHDFNLKCRYVLF